MTQAALAPESATLNMVQGQIAPNGVTEDAVLEAFLAYDRAEFLPTQHAARACIDDDIKDANGHILLLRPLTLALMLQHLVRMEQRGQVAVIGDASGYATTLLRDMGFAAIDVADDTALAAGAPWQGILLNGSVATLPGILFPHLEPQGVVLGVLQPPHSGVGDIVAATAPQAMTTLGQAAAPRLTAFAVPQAFAL